MSVDFTFLTQEQIWGDNALQVMKRYGRKTGMSDLAIVLGGLVDRYHKTSDNQRSGYVWLASRFTGFGGNFRFVRTVQKCGGGGYGSPCGRAHAGARPALPSSVVSSIKPGEARLTRKISGVDVVEYGEYPQGVANETVSKELEQSFSRGQLQTTGKKYTFDGEELNAYSKPFKAKEYTEYQHGGKRYIRVEAKPCTVASDDHDYYALSNGRRPQAGEACWIEVQPIEWLKDPSGVWVARQALFSGIPFDRKDSYAGNFADTDMKRYLDTYFSKEMMVGRAVDAPAVVGPRTAAVVDGREAQRRRALEDPSQGL